MIQITDRIALADDEITWKFTRSSGPGGQNVNKVASKAALIWNIAASRAISEDVKSRLAQLFKRFFNGEGQMVVGSQRYRDQDRNRGDCVDKLRLMIEEASVVPKKRRKTRPTRSSKERRLAEKKHRAAKRERRDIP